MMFIYRANFNLTDSVNDFDSAYAYLLNDDMTKYLLGDDRGCKKVVSVQWILETESSGIIEVKTNAELTDLEKKNISEWISGQCSDGLGEGFEQQDFANYYIGDDLDYYNDEDWIMASFDWETNNYDLELVERIEN
jgi:hypothetical protein